MAVAAPLRKTLSYAHPEGLPPDPELTPGLRVLVPLGRRLVTGYILGRAVPSGDKTSYTTKPVAEVLDSAPLFPENMIPFFRWVAEYYHHPIGEVIRTALPGGLTAGSAKTIRLTEAGAAVLAVSDELPDVQDQAWFAKLLAKKKLPGATVKTLLRQPAGKKILTAWERQGFIEYDQDIRRSPIKAKKETLVRFSAATAELLRQAGQGKDIGTTGVIETIFPDLKKSEKKTLAILLELAGPKLSEPVLQPDITRRYSSAGKALRGLEQMGLICRTNERVYRDPFDKRSLFYPRPENLTPEQKAVLKALGKAMDTAGFQVFLLHGVTGCGKTEVYLRAAEKILARGKSVLVLVPEIALASQLEGHFHCRFGDRLALLHSGLSPAQRHDQWQLISSGTARIVIGARSAVFAPLADLGLVIVDEEHEPAYKQDDGLRYNGRDLAILRARFSDCPVVLGSATPSVTSFHHGQKGKYTLLSMESRVHDQVMPVVEVVDLGRDRASRPDLFFSDRLITALWDNMEQRRQSLLFVNRRGFAGFMMCRDCGHIIECRNCKVSLTQHRSLNRLVCHYCGYSLTAKIICPDCGSSKVEGMGLGSERIEEEVRQLIPHARVARLDSDTASSRKQFLKILRDVHQGDVDILVGTQMIAKGLHFPNMTLVGVVWADSSLGMPDFRASERTYQLLAQVTGRAGRGEHPGRVIIQTYQPDHYAVQCARDHDFNAFFNREQMLRNDLQYPPFARMVNIRFSSIRETAVKETADRVGSFLREECERRGWHQIDILGPAPSPLARIKNRFRYQLMLKSGHVSRLHQLCELLLAAAPMLCPRHTTMTLDVDPENMM